MQRFSPTGRTPARLGVLGGGQLARMMVPPAHRLGVRVHTLERTAGSPAALAGAIETVGDWNDPATLIAFGAELDVVTLDHEFVDASALEALAASGVAVRPGASVLARIQDKLAQKQTLAAAGIPVAAFRPVQRTDDLISAGRELGWPLVLKTRRNGYDGRGNRTVHGPDEAAAAFAQFAGRPGGLYVEQFVPFARELAVMVARSLSGEIALYPVVETVQRSHICHVVTMGAPIAPGVADRARRLASAAAQATETVGVMGVELFETTDGAVLVNELAPRPHNSGHYTIEACRTSQFENHVRAVLGYPLGDPSPIVNAAVMINLLGDGAGPGHPAGLADALAVPGVAAHLYQKATASYNRKMGHVTATGNDLAETLARARTAAAAIRFAQ
ncbi:MAG: 5-(carboxyamino)imidazole ribonucleotide synthase [Dehalococcoidia bacterium]|nr:5-(carboxyamino)imidazole ribonucleotide synthase [Dehalococcoidia bacterium]